MLISIYIKISILVGFIFIMFYLFGYSVFTYWSGLNDPNLMLLFQLFLVFTILVILDNVSVVFLSALKLNKVPTLVSIGQGIFGIILSILLLNYIGYIGIIVGFLASFMLTNLFFNPFYLLKSINKKLDKKVI